ncbi:MAG: FtsX-like permease family protein, partial [bacterium]|nr:FtsX-like permease family protein [bacterium]
LLFPPGATIEGKPDVWIANDEGYDRSVAGLRVIGRLKRGVTVDQARAAVAAAGAELQRIAPRLADLGTKARLEPMQGYLVAKSRPAILALMGSVVFLLLTACANVANLLLVRVFRRERELAVRTALGGSRWRLIQQTLTEAVLLAGLGTLLGVGLAWLGIRWLLVLAPANLPRLESIAIDWRVLAFAAATGLATAVIFGVMPALRASRPEVTRILRGGRTSSFGAGRLLRNGVVVAEVALSFALLIGSGLMFRSFLELRRIDPGYDPQGVLTFLLVRDWDHG